MAKWIDGERPKPPIDVSQTIRDIEEMAVAWRYRGYSWSEVAAPTGIAFSQNAHRRSLGNSRKLSLPQLLH